MNWIEYISQLTYHDKTLQYGFNSVVPYFLLQEFQTELGLREMPNELMELYRESDGVNEILDNQKIGELIWTADRVIKTNNEFRNNGEFKKLYMSFEQLLFISDAGNGDLFGFVTIDGRFDRNDIFVWNHEDDSRTWVAPNLAKFIEWWTNGKIKV